MTNLQTSLRRRIIQALTERDGFTCHYCGNSLTNSLAGFNKDGASIDHVTPKDCGGTDDLQNLVLACRSCNQKKRSRHYQEFAMAMQTDRAIAFVMGVEK